ncbi:hypothetical protein [Mesorhizobium sp.]|uniref:hypothetical protein n=1 Tax=Mesorhizobium sp. TaxID=1871066 RepID=UPI0025BB5CB3|nr:hypothetical protein [Mesorhizobium sp.]
MTYAAIGLLLAAASLRNASDAQTLALWLLKASNALHVAGARTIENLEADLNG